LTLVKVFIGRKEYPRALMRCQRLLAVTKNDNFQAQALLDLVEVQRAMGLKQLADATLAKLLSEHPYSEAAALAKDRWGKK
jgi:TolA-binding protein